MEEYTFGLSNIARLSSAKSRSISAENLDGSKGGGARAEAVQGSASDMLGTGWKVRPCLNISPGVTTLAEITGPGTIRHIWITVDPKAYRDCILRMFWDGEETPSVEVPLGDFFANGHAVRANVDSIPVAVCPTGGFNCYWPMPFRKSARLEVDNQRAEATDDFFFQIDYALHDVPNDAAYFHAQWRRSVTPIERPEHVILDGVRGRGHYVGTYLAWTQLSNGWWGEGEVKFFLDGDVEFPTICGTGTEDYFGGAWCFYDADGKEETFCRPFVGYPLCIHKPNEVIRHGLYRWHIPDPIRFETDIRATIQALGWWPNGRYQPLQDDIASTAYWYQTEPHAKFPELLPVHLRWPR